MSKNKRKKIEVSVEDCCKGDVHLTKDPLQRAVLFSLKHENMTFNYDDDTYEIVGVKKSNNKYTISLLVGEKPSCEAPLLTLD